MRARLTGRGWRGNIRQRGSAVGGRRVLRFVLPLGVTPALSRGPGLPGTTIRGKPGEIGACGSGPRLKAGVTGLGLAAAPDASGTVSAGPVPPTSSCPDLFRASTPDRGSLRRGYPEQVRA